jgi:UDPglucose 6-dehydrogenase
LAGRRIAVWGLAFKANTDDVRESPAFTIVDTLLDNKAVVSAYDPQAMLNTRNIYGERITYARDQYSALAGAEALVVATEWNVFRHPNFDRMKNLMKTPLVFDGRNLFDPARMREMGFEYYSVGRV